MTDYNLDYNTTSSAIDGVAGGVFAGLAIVLIIMCIIALVVGILQLIGTWKTLKKAGRGGWEAIIPFYNSVVLCQIAGVNPWWVLIVCGSSILLSAVPVLGLVSAVASIYFMILLNVSIARSFGKEDGFAVGLILLAPIFYMVLGCGKSEYVGAKPMNDFLFKNNNTNTQNATVTPSVDNSQSSVKYCAGCGTQVDQTTKFCPKCGQEVK